MLEFLCFDICALAILITLFISVKSKVLDAERSGRRLSLLIHITMFSCVTEIAVTLFNYYFKGNHTIGFLLLVLSNIFSCAMLYCYANYIAVYLGTWHLFGLPSIKSARFIPLFLIAIISLTAPYTDAFYGYAKDGTFVHYEMYMVISLINSIYVFYSIYFIIKNLKVLGILKTFILTICSTFYLIAILIQYRHPNLIVSILGFTISITVIVMFVDNPEDKYDDISKLMNNNTFLENLKVNFFTNKSFDIIQINLQNNRLLEEMLSFDKYSLVIKMCSEKLSELNSRLYTDAGLYYLSDGRFRVVTVDSNLEKTMEFANLALEAFNIEINKGELSVKLETSVNITRCQEDFDNLEDLLSFKTTAEKYEQIGKITFSKDIIETDKFSIGNNIDKLIEKAVVNNSFRVCYSPIFSVEKGKFIGVEAITKIFDNDKGIIEPSVFMERAEQNGAINEIGIYTIGEVCRLISSYEFRNSGLESIGINMSAIQCLQKNLSEIVIEMLEEYDIKPEQICFEITESIASDNQKTFIDNIQKLSDYGIHFSLDNYGSGYSNIINMSSMPIGAVKFDESFVNCEGNVKMEVILENSINMIKALEKKIIIEGVKTKEDVEKFSKMGCEYLQGEYYSQALEAGDLFWFIKEYGRKNAL